MKKKKLLILLAASAFTLSACGIDDDYLRSRGFSVDGDNIYVDRGSEERSSHSDSPYENDGTSGGTSYGMGTEYGDTTSEVQATTEADTLTERSTNAPTEAVTESTTEAVAYREDIVTDDPDMTMTLTSINTTREFKVPHINYDSRECDMANSEIKEIFDKGMEDIQYVYDDDGNVKDMYCGYAQISYDWYLLGDILSIEVQAPSNESAHVDYLVYNIDLPNDREVDDDTLFYYAGVSLDEYRDLSRGELKKWLIHTGYIDDDGNYLISDPMVETAVSKTLSDDNIDDCLPYIGQDGAMYIIAKCYGIAGPDYIIRTFKLKQVI